MKFLHPYTIHEAEVAIWPSRADGMPITPPSGTSSPVPAAQCHASIKISQAPRAREDSRHANWQGSSDTDDALFTLELSGLFGAYTDQAPIPDEINRNGLYTVVIRWLDDSSGEWRKLQFHYASFTSSSIDGSPALSENLTLTSPWRESTAGNIQNDGIPSIAPEIYGTIEWCHGGRNIATHRQVLGSFSWTSLPRNTSNQEAGGGTPLVELVQSDGDKIISLSYLDLLSATPKNPSVEFLIPDFNIYSGDVAVFTVSPPPTEIIAGATVRVTNLSPLPDGDYTVISMIPAIAQLTLDVTGSGIPIGPQTIGENSTIWHSSYVNEWHEASFATRNAFSVGLFGSTAHGLGMDDDTELEVKGIPEALFAHLGRHPEHRPEVRFRVLRRLYASIQNGILAIPQISQHPPGIYGGPPLKIKPNAALNNPNTNHNGIHLLPGVAHLDGPFLGGIDESELLLIP